MELNHMELEYKKLSENFVGKVFKKNSLHPFMKKYSKLNENGLFSLNFNYTIFYLKKIIEYIQKKQSSGENINILFVDMRYETFSKNEETLPENVFFADKWINGFITNFKFAKIRNKSEYNIKKYKGLSKMDSIPDLVICANMFDSLNVIKECRKKDIKTACITGSRSNPRLVNFPIIGNDFNETSVKFIFNYLINNISLNSREDVETDTNKEII